MRAIQRINHNAAICEDGAGRQLIALGRGIGFGDMPHEVDLDVLVRLVERLDRRDIDVALGPRAGVHPHRDGGLRLRCCAGAGGNQGQ